MIGWALCFELIFCIILYDTLFFFCTIKGGEQGVSQIHSLVR